MAAGLIGAMSWAIGSILEPMAILLLIVGAMIGMTLGAIPGLGAAITLALLIPISVTLSQSHALLLLIGALGGVNYGGSISSIMLNVPGTAPSVMTTIDGHPMAKQGEGITALGASAVASALGALSGVVFIFLAVPVFRELMRFFGPPEFMLVAIIGMLTISYILEGSFVNGLIAVGIGILMGFHGFDQISGGLRFDFGIVYLYDPIQVVILVLGIFAISEMIKLGTRRETIVGNPESVSGNPIQSIAETLKNWMLIIQSGIVGIIMGFIPGAGATIATLIAYARAKAGAEDPSQFGDGDIRGVIAPEAANDAKDRGALLPTIAFGIPGTPAHAVLLGGLLLHGITPGPSVFTEDLNIVYLLIFGLLLSNFFTSIVGISLIKYIVKVTTIPTRIIIPLVVVTSIFGAFTFRNNPLDILAVLVLGLFGYLAMVFSVSRIAVLFGLILGPILETTYLQTVQIAAGNYARIFRRPVFSGVLLLSAVIIVYLYYRKKDVTVDG